jgi:hypothetical protein
MILSQPSKIKNASVTTLKASLTNKSGAATQAGYVYRMSPDYNDAFEYAADSEDAAVAVATGVINDNAAGDVVISGYTDVYVTGDTDRGDYLCFSATSGQAKSSKYKNDGCFGVATASRSGAGLVKAEIIRIPIRKYSWSDEQSWWGRYVLPLSGVQRMQKPGGIIVGKGGPGDWDEKEMGLFSMAKAGNTIYLPYSGSNASSQWQIGLATASSFTGAYTKDPGGPILSPTEAWETAGGSGLICVAAKYDPVAPNTGEDWKWKVLYGGSASSGYSAIGFAYGADLTSLIKYAGNPVMDHSFGSGINNFPSFDMLMLGEVIICVYRNTAGSFSWAYSENKGKAWTPVGVCLGLGGAGAFDDGILGFPHLYHNQGNVYMTYMGASAASGLLDRKIGMVVTSLADIAGTGSLSFSRDRWNPILSSANPGTDIYDNGAHNEAFIIQDRDVFRFFYAASDSGSLSNRQIFNAAYIRGVEV